MSLKSKIEAVIYASEEPVTLLQLAGLLSDEAATELEALAARQSQLPLDVDTEVSENAVMASPASRESNEVAPEPHETKLPAASADIPLEALSDAEPQGGDDPPTSAPNTSDEASVAEADVPADHAADPRIARERERHIREYLRHEVDTLMRDYAENDRGIEIREVAGGFRMGTKPEYHDAVRGFVKSLKPALKLTLQALETLAVVAYKQPVTAAEISEIRGVDSSGVLGGLMGRKLIATAGRKQVIGRPMLYKTTREFLVRFGLKDVHELPSMEEFERLAGELNEQEDLPMEPTEAIIERANERGDADRIRAVAADALPDNEFSASNDEDGPTDTNDPAEPGGTADEQETSNTADQVRTVSDSEPESRSGQEDSKPEEHTTAG